MAPFIFEDEQPQATATPQFVFEDSQPVQVPPVKQKGILESAVDPFAGAGARMAQGFNESLGATNESFGMDNTIYKDGVEYWNRKADESGSTGIPAKIYQAIGAAPVGVVEFVAGPVYAGVKGGMIGYRENGIPGALEKAAIEVAKRVGIGKIFHGIENTGISGLPKAAAMGGTMGAQTAAEQAMTDKGIQPEDVAASAITGTLLSVQGGGKSEFVRSNLIKEGVQPEIATDLAGRVPSNSGRFAFEDQAEPLPRNEGAGVNDSFTIDPSRQKFIDDQVESLGSVEAVDRMYTGNSQAEQYARQVAREMFNHERGFTLGAQGPLQTRTDLPLTEGEVIPPAKTAAVEPQIIDGQIIPRALIENKSSKNAVESSNGLEPLSWYARNEEIYQLDSPFSFDKLSELKAHADKIEKLTQGLGETKDPALSATIQKAKQSLAEIKGQLGESSPLKVTYHPDNRIELSFPGELDKKTINRLKQNNFNDQGDGVWIAKGAGKARKEFVEGLRMEAVDQSKSGGVEPGKVEQFAATPRKRGGQELFNVNLSPSQRRTLETVRQEISDGEAGKRVGIYNTNEPGSTQIAWGSSFPEYFQNKGYTKAHALKAIDNILSGEGVTAAQRIMVEDMHQAKRHQETNVILSERAKPSEVSALHLDEGDTLKRNGEMFEVKEVSPDGVTLKDGVVMELNHEQSINYDRGTLKDADGKQKKISVEPENAPDLFSEDSQPQPVELSHAEWLTQNKERIPLDTKIPIDFDEDGGKVNISTKAALEMVERRAAEQEKLENLKKHLETKPLNSAKGVNIEAIRAKAEEYKADGHSGPDSIKKAVDATIQDLQADRDLITEQLRKVTPEAPSPDTTHRFEKTPAGDQGKLFATPPEFGKKPQPSDRVSTDELPLAEHSIKDLEGTQGAFPDMSRVQQLRNSIAEGELILKTGELHGRKFNQAELSAVERQVEKEKSALDKELSPYGNSGVILDSLGLQQIYERIAQARLIKDVMADIKALGRHVLAKGANTFKEFFQGMRENLGNLFSKVRPVIERLWKTLDNERGSIEIEAPRFKEAWDGILRAVNPMERGRLAQKAGELLRERMGVREMNRKRFTGELDDAVKQYEERIGIVAKTLDNLQNSGRTLVDKIFNKMTEQESYDFMQAMDIGDREYFADKPALRDIAAVIDSMFKTKVNEIQNLGTGIMENVRESYFPHIWEKDVDPAKLATMTSNKPLEGNKGFSKQRVFEDIQAGLDAGFKPVSQNPLDLVFLKMGEMDKYIAAHKGLQSMVDMGVVQLVPVGEKTPEGFHDIAGRYGTVSKQGYMNPETGLPELKAYRYVAVDEVAQVFNNYLSPTLYSNKYVGSAFTAYMDAANQLNAFQLGVGSLFHGGFTSLEAIISKNALGLRALSKGNFKDAAEYFSAAIAAPVQNWKQGQKILDAISSGSAPQGQMKDIVDWLQLAGARTSYDERFRTNQTQKVMESWANGKHFGAAARSPLAVVEQSSRIILEHIVPQQKLGVFYELMHQWTKENPNTTHEQLRTAAQQKWSRADARLGQVNYERYFIHNAVKNGLQALIRAPGWSAGTIFELGGGGKDAAQSITKLLKGEQTELSDRTAYAASLVITTAIANGLATLFFTGDMPKGMDFLAFRTGNLDEKGKPERFVLPTYMKDLYAYSQAPLTTLMHKTHPVISLGGELIKNKDFYGTEIRHSGDNPAKQIVDTVFHTAKAFTPFWMRGVSKERERGGTVMGQVAPFFGVMPAPADMNATAAEKLAREFVVGKLPQGSKTKEQFEKREFEHKIETALRKMAPEARMMIQQAKRDKLITPRDEQEIRQKAVTPPIVSATRSLDFEQAMKVWEVADDQERAKLKQPFIAKGERWLESHPDQEKETRSQLQEIRRFVRVR